MVYRTQPLVSLQKIGKFTGTWHNFRQIRQAAKQVAFRNGVQVLDAYNMLFGERPEGYVIDDGYHICDHVNYELMNVALNILAAHRRKLSALQYSN